MRFPSLTRRESWVYATILTAMCGASPIIVTAVQMHCVSESIRSRIHRGQSMPEVLSAAEKALAAQGVLTSRRALMTYVVSVHCEDQLWLLWRDPGGDGRAEFRIHVAGSEAGHASFRERAPLTTDEVFRLAEANARGCTVHIGPGGLEFAVGDDGRVAAVEPPQP